MSALPAGLQAVHYTGRRKWQPEEVAAGVYLSLGLSTDTGVMEVTRRAFISFVFETSGPITGAYSRARKFDGPFAYDVLVFAKLPAGGPVDFAYNGGLEHIGADGCARVTVKWDGLREKESVARQLYLDQHNRAQHPAPPEPKKMARRKRAVQ